MASSSSPSSTGSRLATPEDDLPPVADTDHCGPAMLSLDDLLQADAFSASAYSSNPQSFTPSSKPVPAVHPPSSPLNTSRRQDPSLVHHKIVFPDKNSVQNLSLVFPSLPPNGTKSRVETQVRVVMDLADSCSPIDPLKYDRVGSWKWLKLPEGTATKKRMRKQAKIDPPPEDTLYLTTSVSCASPPYSSVLSCTSCQTRESKRVAKKLAARVKPQYSDSDNQDSEKVPTKKPYHEDVTSILHFNCAQLLEISSGSVALPMRITCYCRHHKEKVGFNVHFTMLDHSGRIIATGSTPHIMITDDHKTMQARQNDASQQSWSALTATPSELSGSKGKSEIKIKGSSKSARKRAKPYDTLAKHQRVTSRDQWPESGPPSPSSTTSQLPLTRSPTPPTFEQLMKLEQPPPSLSQLPPLHQGSSMESESSPDALATPLDYQSDVPMVSLEDDISLPIPSNILPSHPHAIPFLFGGEPTPASLPVPTIHRLIPNSGPTHGGIEVTVLGANFHAHLPLQCVFGDVASTSIQRWSDNTLVCILPPRSMPGVVAVWFEGFPRREDSTDPPSLFTYTSESDRALMELALQVVGLKMTGKLEDAKHVAMRIVGTSGGEGSDAQSTPTNGSTADFQQFNLDAELGSAQGMEATALKFLKLLESGPTAVSVSDVLSHGNVSGQTLLHLAAFSGYTGLLDTLIKYDVDLDIRDRNGFTALHFAALAQSSSAICTLLAAGADVQVVNAVGKTPQELASRQLAELFPQDSTDSREDDDEDDEAQWGDAEDEVVAPRRAVRTRCSRGLGRSSPVSSRLSSSDEANPMSAKVDKEHRKKADMAVEKHTETLVEMIQRTLGDKLPGAQGLMENMPALPHLFTLPHLPLPPLVFPVHIPVNPALIPALPAIFGGEQPPVDNVGSDEDKKGAMAPTTLHELRATWEKWFAVALAIALRQQADEPPPEYTPRAPEESQPSDDSVPSSHTPPIAVTDASSPQGNRPTPPSRRLEYNSVQVSENELEAYAYQPSQKQKEKIQKKDDRMLLLFWIPVLLISLLWGLHSSVRFAFQTIKSAIPLRG